MSLVTLPRCGSCADCQAPISTQGFRCGSCARKLTHRLRRRESLFPLVCALGQLVAAVRARAEEGTYVPDSRVLQAEIRMLEAACAQMAEDLMVQQLTDRFPVPATVTRERTLV